MTLTQIKSMFAVGQKWHALREEQSPIVIAGNLGTTVLQPKHRDEIREVYKLGSKEIVFKLADGKSYYTPWPKASEVIEARPGFLKFAICEGKVTVTLKHIDPEPDLSRAEEREISEALKSNIPCAPCA